MNANIAANTENSEKRVGTFYAATVPGHRESLRGLQAPHFVAEEFISAREEVVTLGHIQGQPRKTGAPSMCLSPTSGPSATGIFKAACFYRHSAARPCAGEGLNRLPSIMMEKLTVQQ